MLHCEKLFEQYLNADKEGSHFEVVQEFLIQSIKCFLMELNYNENEVAQFYKIQLQKVIENRADKKNISFLIELAWEIPDIKNIQTEINSLALYLLDKPKINNSDEYYLEQIIDLLNYKTANLVPIQILKRICFADLEDKTQYGAFIKAISYLNRHDPKIVESILVEFRQTDRYKNDEYIREWVD